MDFGAAALMWSVDQIVATLCAGVLIVTVFGYGSLILGSHQHHKKVRTARSALTLEDFIREFSDAPHDPAILQMAFSDFLKRYGSPVHRSDQLLATLGLLDEDIEDMLQERAALMGVAWEDFLATIDHQPATVEQYVHLLENAALLASDPLRKHGP